jgi:hypothetical protein
MLRYLLNGLNLPRNPSPLSPSIFSLSPLFALHAVIARRSGEDVSL